MAGGASGYLLKSSAASELIQAVDIALKSGLYVTPQIARRMQQPIVAGSQQKTLTPRQREVVQRTPNREDLSNSCKKIKKENEKVEILERVIDAN